MQHKPAVPPAWQPCRDTNLRGEFKGAAARGARLCLQSLSVYTFLALLHPPRFSPSAAFWRQRSTGERMGFDTRKGKRRCHRLVSPFAVKQRKKGIFVCTLRSLFRMSFMLVARTLEVLLGFLQYPYHGRVIFFAELIMGNLHFLTEEFPIRFYWIALSHRVLESHSDSLRRIISDWTNVCIAQILHLSDVLPPGAA